MKSKTHKQFFGIKVHEIIFPIIYSVFCGILFFAATQSYWSLLWLLFAPFFFWINPKIEKALSKDSYKEKLDNMAALMAEANEEPNLIKREMLLSVIAMRNANSCALHAMYGLESEKPYWLTLANFYDKLRIIHREKASDLAKENNIN